jgi:hypothetical protein
MSRGELLMNIDEKIEYAQKIFKMLPGNIKTEFSKFLNYLREYNFGSAFEFLKVQKDSELLRSKQKKHYEKFYEAIEKYEKNLRSMSKEEDLEILSYVLWEITIKEELK